MTTSADKRRVFKIDHKVDKALSKLCRLTSSSGEISYDQPSREAHNLFIEGRYGEYINYLIHNPCVSSEMSGLRNNIRYETIVDKLISPTLFNYAAKFRITELMNHIIHDMDEIVGNLIGFYDLEGLNKILEVDRDSKNNTSLSIISGNITGILTQLRELYLIDVNDVIEQGWSGRVWIEVEDPEDLGNIYDNPQYLEDSDDPEDSNIIDNIRDYLELAEFDPTQVIKIMNERKMFVQSCYSIIEHAIIRRVNYIKGKLCEYTVTDFDEDYIEDLLFLFSTNRITINAEHCSRAFRKCFSDLMMERHKPMAVGLGMNTSSFLRGHGNQAYLKRADIAEMHDILTIDHSKRNTYPIIHAIMEVANNLNGGEWLRPSLELILKIDPKAKFLSRYQYIEYLFGDTFFMYLTIVYGDSIKNLDLNNIEELMNSFIERPKSTRKYGILDRIYHLAKKRDNAAILSRTDNKLLQWIAEDRNVSIKSSRK